MSLALWGIIIAMIGVLYVVVLSAMRAAGKADAEMEAAQHDAYLAREAARARDAARFDNLRNPDRVRDDDGFRRD